MIAQGFSGLVHPDAVPPPAGGIPRVRQGDTQKSCTNRASTGVASNIGKRNQPGFYRCGQGAVLADCAREGAETKSNGYRYHSTPEQGFFLIRIFTDDANWASTSVARTSGRSGNRTHIGQVGTNTQHRVDVGSSKLGCRAAPDKSGSPIPEASPG